LYKIFAEKKGKDTNHLEQPYLDIKYGNEMRSVLKYLKCVVSFSWRKLLLMVGRRHRFCSFSM